ncbi:MAG: rhodanese-like domain-containing protein [Bacillota bacterium]|nr:rhodanese-like domain-containing protein [Bacillota bacterium]
MRNAFSNSNQECILLDVREQNEYQESHIPGALLLNVADIETKRVKEL